MFKDKVFAQVLVALVTYNRTLVKLNLTSSTVLLRLLAHVLGRLQALESRDALKRVYHMRVVVFKCLCGLVSRLEKVSLCRLSS